MNTLGKKGEEYVAEVLRKKGYRIIARNFRLGKDEIDIVAYRSKIHFLIEVKTISSRSVITGGQQMTIKKQKFFERAAQKYAKKFRPQYMRLLFAEVVILEEKIQSLIITKYS